MAMVKKGFNHYFVQLHLLDKFLEDKVKAGETLKVGLTINGKKNVSELDMRVDALMTGFRKASLTPKERAKLTEMKKAIYKRFG